MGNVGAAAVTDADAGGDGEGDDDDDDDDNGCDPLLGSSFISTLSVAAVVGAGEP